MIKKLTAVFTSVLITLCITLPAFAAPSKDWQNREIPEERQLPRAVDYTDTFSDTQLKQLNDKLDTLSDKWDIDIACVLDYDIGSYGTATEYADDYYDYNGLAEDGILFAVFSESRDWGISTRGKAISVFKNCEKGIVSYLIDELSNDSFYSAFDIYANRCDKLLNNDSSEANGDDYASDKAKPELKTVLIAVGISVIIGIASGFIGTGIMKSKLKSVKFQSGADDYVVPNSFKMHDSRDVYLYSTVTKTERPTNDNTHSGGSHGGGTHISSSGSIHGGSSGKF